MVSGTIEVVAISHWSLPSVLKTSWSTGIHLSEDGSLAAVSETIRIAARSFGLLILMDKIERELWWGREGL